MQRVRIPILLVFCLFASEARATARDAALVYFIPFDVETYVAVTRNDIIAQAWEKWTVVDGAAINRLARLFKPTNKQEFNEAKVRCLVILKGERYFIDANGIALKDGGTSLSVDRARFLAFGDSIAKNRARLH